MLTSIVRLTVQRPGLRTEIEEVPLYLTIDAIIAFEKWFNVDNKEAGSIIHTTRQPFFVMETTDQILEIIKGLGN